MCGATNNKAEIENFELKSFYLPPRGFCCRKGPVKLQSLEDLDIPHHLELLGLQQKLQAKIVRLIEAVSL